MENVEGQHIKDFDGWNVQKKKLDDQRPVLIIRQLSKDTYIVAPLTSSSHKNKMRIPIGLIRGKKNYVVISQLRVVDFRRMVNRLTILSEETFLKIRKAARDLF